MLLRSCRGPGIQAAVFSLIGHQRLSLRPPIAHLLASSVRRTSGASSLVVSLSIYLSVHIHILVHMHLTSVPGHMCAHSLCLCFRSCSMKDTDDGIAAPSWDDLGYHPKLASALAQHFRSPSEIQELAAAPLMNHEQLSSAPGTYRSCPHSPRDGNKFMIVHGL